MLLVRVAVAVAVAVALALDAAGAVVRKGVENGEGFDDEAKLKGEDPAVVGFAANGEGGAVEVLVVEED